MNDFNSKMNYDSFFTSKPNDPSVIIIDDEVMSEPVFSYFENTGSNACYFAKNFDNDFIHEAETKTKINSPSKKISKNKESVNNIRLAKKKPSKKNIN
jgi:hypothetical protein